MNQYDSLFPPEFDFTWFAIQNNLENMSAEEAKNYFQTQCKEAGILGSPLCAVSNFCEFLNTHYAEKKALEIGPGACPRIRVKDVQFFDIRNVQELQEWAKASKLPLTNIPPVIHHVSACGDLSSIKDKFDLVFSSHNIEHSVDLITYINDISNLLNPNGIFACIVPDKRYTFDYYRECSDMSDVVAQHLQPASLYNHPLRVFLDSLLSSTHNEPVRHWSGDHGNPPAKESQIKNFLKLYQTTQINDTHRWVFTQDSFKKLFNALFENGFINMKLIRCYNVPKNGNGFNAVFVKKDDLPQKEESHSLTK